MTLHANLLGRAALAACCVALAAAPALAEGPKRMLPRIGALADENGPERIDYSGKLTMLSQRAAAAACNKAAGIGGWEAEGYLAASIGEFDRIMAALVDGDVFISIKLPERDSKVLRRIEATEAHWTAVRGEMRAMVAGEATPEQLKAAAGTAPELLELIERMVAEIVGAYADPATLLASDAMTLDIVGRERMMPQVISKWSCMLSEGLQPEEARIGLEDAVAHYDLALGALRNGMPEVGVTPPPSAAIEEQLTAVDARWQEVRPLLVGLQSGTALSAEERETVFYEMNALTAQMNEVSRLYALASKQGS